MCHRRCRVRPLRPLGNVLGGPIAITYAARHPERVNRLILYGTYALGRLRWKVRPKEIEKAPQALVEVQRNLAQQGVMSVGKGKTDV